MPDECYLHKKEFPNSYAQCFNSKTLETFRKIPQTFIKILPYYIGILVYIHNIGHISLNIPHIDKKVFIDVIDLAPFIKPYHRYLGIICAYSEVICIVPT